MKTTIVKRQLPVESPEARDRLTELYAIGKQIPEVPADLIDPQFSENAWYIGRTRYARRNASGESIETPREVLWRVAYNVATAERLYSENPADDHLSAAREFYGLMARQEYIANTPTMVNAGKPHQQLSACFVLPVEDSLESILGTATDMARIHKSGGGTGFSFSRLRPMGDIVAGSGGTTTGPVAFMQTFNDITTSIRQGGIRRGANMGILHYTHPDILLFAVYKVDEFSLTNFNISVTVDEAFYQAVERDAQHLATDYELGFDFETVVCELRAALSQRDVDLKLVQLDAATAKLRAWCNETDPNRGFGLINPRTGLEVGRLNAKKFYDLITRLAWQYGDPGMIMIDRINNSRANPTPQLGQIEATNPCGEQPLLPYDACTLGSINLAKFVSDGDLDWPRLRTVVHQTTRFLDDVLDMNEYPIEQVRQTTRAIRRIGLGIMGFADALLSLEIGYNTEAGTAFAEKVMKFIQQEADIASVKLARTRGVFPAFAGSIYDRRGEIRPRNGARTTIAPTGTIAMLADCSSGCEPLFALTYAKNTIEGKRIFQTSPYFVAALKKRGIYSDELLERIQDNGGSVQGLEDIPDDLQQIFVVAGDISPEWHLKIQAAFQRYTDNAISKTINFSNNATVEDVRNAYWLAYASGCKGITIYRDGSRNKQILETKKAGSYYDQLSGGVGVENAITAAPLPRVRPEVLRGHTYKVATPVGTAFISINEDEAGEIFEVFVNVGRAGSDIMADAEAIGRLISLSFRTPGASTSSEIAANIVGQLSGIGGSSSTGFGPARVRSMADAIAKAIREHEAVKSGPAPVFLPADTQPPTAGPVSSGSLPTVPSEPTSLRVAPEEGYDGTQRAERVSTYVIPTAAGPVSNITPGPGLNVQTDLCPECGNASLRFIEGCAKCELCGFSKC